MRFSLDKQLTYSELLSRQVAIVTCIFALIYHTVFLCLFQKFNIPVMFHFNLCSVPFFLILTFLIVRFPKLITGLYFLSIIEVIAHQVHALLNVGGNSGFHYMILIMTVIPYLVFQNKKHLAIPTSIFCAAIFIYLDGYRINFDPRIGMPDIVIKYINYSNITLSNLVILLTIMIYSISSKKLEDQLAHEVEDLAQQMLIKNNQIIELQNNTIIGLSNLVESRDGDTGKHVQRTSAYVELIATQLKREGFFRNILTEDYINLLVKAAPMHDIGKIVVPDEILKKPGKLTQAEFSKMQLHTVEGKRIINEVLGQSGDLKYIETASEIATYHHEKWNGKGYPNQLSGTNIPLSARIMAIADVFDALVSPRCYKQPFTVDKACQIIKDDTGVHFDPTIARIFLKNRAKAEEIMEKYKD